VSLVVQNENLYTVVSSGGDACGSVAVHAP
jgi:hypothetical protein